MARLVLIADGSPSHQRRAQGILTGEGLEVVTVSNGVAAIKKLPTVKAALVLADVSIHWREIRSALAIPVKSGPARQPGLAKNAVGAN